MQMSPCERSSATCHPKVIYRGPANVQLVIPSWAAYLTLMDVEGSGGAGLDEVPVEYEDGITRFLWNVGQVLAINGGCGYGDTLFLGGPAGKTIEVWATQSRTEAYEDSVRSR